MKETLVEMEALCKRNMNGAKFLSGTDHPMWIDIHVFPIVERIVLLENSPWKHAFDFLDMKNAFPTIYAFVHEFKKFPRMDDSCIT